MTQAVDPISDQSEYRAEVQRWLAANGTPRSADDLWAVNIHASDEAQRAAFDRGVAWQRKLAAAGYAGITWPTDYGGQGGARWKERVFGEEAAQVEESGGFITATIAMLGPTLLQHGTDDQKQRFLPGLISGDLTFCQLFSEPSAGSDLASLATSATRDGDEFIVCGQKVWNSAAQHCDWAFLLARTDPTQPKHRGITFFLVDMASAGIEVRPLIQMNGARHFNEVFLSDVRVPVNQVVGAVDEGWTAARTVLGNESSFIGRSGGASLVTSALELTRLHGRAADPVMRQRLAELWTRERLQTAMGNRISSAVRAGRDVPIDGALLKLYAAETRRLLGNYVMEVAGATAMAGDEAPARWAQAQLAMRFSLSIGGGTNEVQRNNLAERSLGLPREPRTDRNVAWRDTLR